ncbi:MAG: PilW family protein [Gammaproteobacteria bacterium]
MSRRLRIASSAGYSLVELLVALALSLFLIAGIAVMYFSTSQTYHVQQQTAQLQEHERLVATFVGSVVRSAGYYAAPMTNYPDLAFPANTTFAATGQNIYGTSASSGGDYADTVAVRFLTAPGDSVLNCLGFGNQGTASDAYQLYVNQFQLDTADHQLECTVSGPGIATQTQPLLDGVTSFEILYGVDTNGDGSADEYLSGSAIAAIGWSAVTVRSVKMMLKFAAATNPVTGVPEPNAKPISFQAVFAIRATPQ